MMDQFDCNTIKTGLQRLRGDSNRPVDASIIVPINAKTDLETVYGLLSDIATYQGPLRFAVVLMVNNYSGNTVPGVIQALESLGARVISEPSVRRSDEEIFITARMVGLRAAHADYAVLFDADCRLINTTALLDWYVEQFRSGAKVAYTHVEYYDLKNKMTHHLRMGMHRAARWIKRTLFRMPTTRGSNYGLHRETALRLYDAGKLNKDMKIGPVIKADGGRVSYSGKKDLLVLTSGRNIPDGWGSFFRYIGHRFRYHLHPHTSLDKR